MKKLLYIFLLLLTVATRSEAQVSNCCPKFTLQQANATMPCQGDSTCKDTPPHDPNGNPSGGGQNIPTLIACKNSVQSYYVFPNLPGFTFNWTIVGGTPTSTTGNPGVITWGSGAQGILQVIISDASGNCRDTIRRKICLLNSPIADFSIAPNDTICVPQSISFTNNSVGANSYSWDFGDGSGYVGVTPPPHNYANPGTYYVVLTVGNGGGGSAGNSERCGCYDTDTIKVVVLAGTGPVITSPNCKKMYCPGDTATYCVSSGCAPYVWTVNGGTIVSGAGTSCIKVQWSTTTPPVSQFPTGVSVTTGCSGSCSNSATLNVPVLFNNIPIVGPSPVCIGTTATYSLPAMPGTFYHWTITGGGGGTIVAADSNTSNVTVLWNGPAGTATLTCNYNNPYSGCHGSTTMTVNVRKKFIIAGPSPLCVNNSGLYSITGGGFANWIVTPATGYTPAGPYNNLPAIGLTWTTAGTYNIAAGPTAATAANYCNDSSFVSVLVNPRPVLSTIAGPTSICPGNYYTYSVTSNMPGPFVWSVAGGSIISQMGANNDSVVIKFTNVPSHTVTVTQTVNGCSTSATLNVANIPAPTISPNATACRDQQLAYTATGGLPAGSYTWSITPAAAGTIVSGQGSNTVNVLWHGASTPGSSTATISVVVCSYPAVTQTVTITTPASGTITQSGNLCPSGKTLTLSGFTCSQYQWLLNGVPYDTTTTPTTTATVSGSYAVRCLTGCGGYATTFVADQPLPNASISANGPIAYCTGATINLQLAALSTPGYNYQWYNSSGPIGGAITNTTTVNAPGTYYVIITWGNCKDTSNIINVIMQNCDPDCINYVYIKSFNEKSEILAGPLPAPPVAEEEEEKAFVPSFSVSFPTSNCNAATFTGNYSVVTPWTFNTGIHWDFGDGSPIQNSGNAVPITHNYTTPGYYFVTAWITVICPPDGKICTYLDTATVYAPLAANFTPQVNCNTIYMNNQSQNLPGCSYTSAWTVTSGPAGWSFSSPTAFNPTLTVTQSGSYTIQYTMFSAACNCTVTYSQTVTVTLPSASFTVPQTVCAGAPITLTATSGMSSYLWNFGDTYTSTLNPTTTHAWAVSPVNPIITLTVINALGCTATFKDTITVVPPPALTITPDSFICRGGSINITATGVGFTSYSFYHNGNLVQSGPLNTYATGLMGTYWVVANNSTSSCPVTSAQTHIFYNPQPVANIQGSGTACLSGGIAYINLSNSVNDPNCTYVWNQIGSPAVFPNQSYLSTTVNATGNYSFVLTVTNQQGCIARDTMCVVVGNSPTVTVTGGTGSMCAGTLHTFTANATPASPNYVYQWSNGATGPVMSTSLPGMYSVSVFNTANGCSGFGFAGVVKPKPSTILFPIGCDTLCDTDSIIPPLALAPGQNYSMYTVQWFLNGNYGTPIYTGPYLNLALSMPPLVYGNNNISIVVTYNGCSDTSNTYNLFIKKCSDCNCEKSSWGDIVLTPGGDVATPQPTDPKKINAVVIAPGGKKLDCKKTYTLECFKPVTITANYNCADTANCPPKVTYSLQPPTGLPITGTLPLINFTPTASGMYALTMYGWCGDKICDSCVVYFKVTCPPADCNCKGSKWDTITISPAPTDAQPAGVADAKATIGIGAGPVSAKLNCGKEYKLKCYQPYTINAGYLCNGTNCPGMVTATLTGPTGTISGPMAFTFTPTATGTYTLTLYGYCGTKICDSCVIKFNVKCDSVPPPPCCPYNIGVKEPTITTSTLTNPPATIANGVFGISGPAGNLFTEIRAEVVSYNLFSNFNNECLSCKSYPYAWSSMYQPGNIGTMPPKITMYGGATVPAFNPSGAGMYQNPREVIWNNGGTAFALPSSINLSFLLPPASIIDCCELTAKICVKFTFRDKDCKECEVITCFTVVIKPGGGEPPHKDCVCSIKPVLKYEGGSKAVGCGETISLFMGNIPVSLAPNFTCKDPTTGKDCASSGPTVSIKKPDNTVQTLTGPNFNYTFLTPGVFEYTVQGVCNGQKCECKFKVQIPK